VRVAGELEGSDEIMNTALFLGTFPGLTTNMLQAEINVINQLARDKKAC
jgi:CDP-6-deoxy-D-xylo-4-hexulose-3-dehydrase